MRRRIISSIALFVLVLSQSACKTKKNVVDVRITTPPPVAATTNKKAENIRLLKAKDVSFNTLAIKAKANLDFAGNKNNVTMNIRMERDKQIWVSITALVGIEVARALITPDSIKVRNNLQSTHIKKPFSYAYRYTNKQVDFKLLQAILAGNTVPAFLTEQANVEQQNSVWTVDGEQETLAYKILFNALMKVGEYNLNDLKTGQALKVVYGSYQQANNGLFPESLAINSMAGTKKVSIDLEYAKVDRNVPLEFPYTVPRKYELVN